MDTTWNTLAPHEREAHFNPRIAVPAADVHLERAARAAASARERIAVGSRFDLRYGTGPKQTLDVLKASCSTAPAPIVIFIHGGYWRALDKNDHTHLALPFTGAGAVFLNLNYDLCPDVAVSRIAAEIGDGLIWSVQHAADYGGDPDRIYLYGHSAGAHLAAMLMAETWPSAVLRSEQVRGLFAISGIYEPEVARTLSVNHEIGLDAGEAARNDVLRRIPRHAWPTLVAVGQDEPSGWIEQSRAFAAHLGQHGVPAELVFAEGCHHFTFLEILADAHHPLTARMLGQLELQP